MASQVAALDIGYKPRLDLPSSLKFLYLLGAVCTLISYDSKKSKTRIKALLHCATFPALVIFITLELHMLRFYTALFIATCLTL